MDLHHLDLAGLAAGYRSGSFTPREVTLHYLDRIARLDPPLQAWVVVIADRALDGADRAGAELQAGKDRGPLHGIPYGLKDLIDVQGLPTLAGSASRKGHIAAASALVTQRLEAAGAVLLGKLHTVEFSFGGWVTNAHLGTPRNPWDMVEYRVPGGSSSGAGVAVAAGMTPFAIGTDTGGSVRLPASFCGVSGLKTTAGLVDTTGVVGMAPSFDTIGPLARSAADLALILPVIADTPAAMLRQKGLPVLARLRPEDCGSGAACPDPAVWVAYEVALTMMSEAGATIREFRLPRALADYIDQSVVIEAEAYASHGALAEDPDQPLDPNVRARLLRGRVSAESYLQALWRLPALRAEFMNALGEAEVLLTPTTPMTAPALAGNDEGTTPALLTRAVNFMGLCAIALPDGFDPKGLPTSLQMIAGPQQEVRLLDISIWYQNLTNWHHRRPEFAS